MDNEMLDAVIREKQFIRIGNRTVVCCLILKNDYEISATSCAGKLEDFDEEKGKFIAFNNACDALENYLKIGLQAKSIGAVDFNFVETEK